MGMVAVTLNIMPASVDTDLAKIKDEIKKLQINVKTIEEKPVAFGLRKLEVLFTMEDADGGIDRIEEAIGKIEGVESVEAGDISLV
ncbi:MAG: elongation factor 1-beta [Candidatus Aenigmarchaeota archaeon]|nr:elongation factor 1-beta [Candidatus Aenigmarchaeota archaeon]MBS3054740.1 elongation factor 1-beta [Candidatus Aenigmarchaeota archaeon]